MSDFCDPTPRATLAPALLNTLVVARRLQDEIRDLRELLHCAVDMLREQNHKLDAARRYNQHLRLELRAIRQDQAA
jgi:hypothetical protein